MGDQLLESLRALWRRLDDEVWARWNRHLPFGEYLVDRWEKATRLGFGTRTSIYDSAVVFGDVRVGADTWIGPFTILDGSGATLRIGDHCSISAGVHIYTHDTVRWAVSAGSVPYSTGPTTIGDNCYIGPYAVISRGVTIGSGCIVAAHSVVREDVPAGMKVRGNPAEIVGPVDVTTAGN